MTTKLKTGLTLGKFAPLHKGHQFLIETALREVDTLYVVIYDSPQVTAIPLSVRAKWIRDLYPRVKVIEAWDGPADEGYTPRVKQIQEAYVQHKLGDVKIDAFYSSEMYGEHMSTSLGAVNRVVDLKREAVPVSGTKVRLSPYESRAFVPPIVAKDLVTHVLLLGAPSTGKTTLCTQLARRFETVWTPEYGREYWEKHQVDRRLTPEQMVEIATGHLEREDLQLAQANRYLFTDTNALTTYLFAKYYHGFALPALEKLATDCFARYDLVFVCNDDIPYDNTWDRSGEVNRSVFQKQLLAELAVRKIPYVLISGTLEQRVAHVAKVLGMQAKYEPLLKNTAFWQPVQSMSEMSKTP
ncbi:MAG TPA: AAA family ATPase [Acidobacteriota bacterium]|nr:AAA family ATPase [Acidobacteriota bacterium]